MKLLRQLGAVLLLLVSCVTAVMACSNPGVRMTVAESACCRMMHNECERMGMSSSSDCCQKVSAGAPDYIVESKVVNHHVLPIATLWLTVSELCNTASIEAAWVEHADYSPPHAPPRSISVLRI